MLEDGEGSCGQASPGFAHGLLGFVVEHDRAFDEVSDEFSAIGVSESLVVEQFAGFSEVVEKESHHDDVAVDLWIERANAVSDLHEREGVLKESTEVRVVQTHGCGSGPERVHQVLVSEVGARERLHGGVFEGFEKFEDFCEHLVWVTLAGWEEVAELFRGGFVGIDVVDDDLELALVGLGFAFDIDEAVGGEAVEVCFVDGPHSACGLTRGISEEAAEVGLPVLGHALLGVGDGEHAVEAF